MGSTHPDRKYEEALARYGDSITGSVSEWLSQTFGKSVRLTTGLVGLGGGVENRTFAFEVTGGPAELPSRCILRVFSPHDPNLPTGLEQSPNWVSWLAMVAGILLGYLMLRWVNRSLPSRAIPLPSQATSQPSRDGSQSAPVPQHGAAPAPPHGERESETSSQAPERPIRLAR